MRPTSRTNLVSVVYFRLEDNLLLHLQNYCDCGLKISSKKKNTKYSISYSEVKVLSENMSCKNKSARTEIITLKNSSALDKVIERVPKPKGAVPNFGLPKWKTIPLESKIPMFPAPKGAYDFSRRKLGEKLWIGSQDAEFNLNDPCNYEVELKYEGFHDEHLTEFYKRPINIQRMIKLGFVTENLDVKCSLREYNMYRKYLKKLHNDSVKKELQKEDEPSIERKVIKYAEEKAKRDMERLRKMETAENCKEAAKRRNKLRERRFKSKIRNYMNRVKQIEQTKREGIRERIEKNKEKMDKMRQGRDMAAILKRRKLAKTINDWKRKEAEHLKMAKIRSKKEENEKEQFIQDRWEKKQQYQCQIMERERFLKHYIEQERQMFIQAYNKKIENGRRKMQNLLEKSKKFVKCQKARYLSGRRKRTCCEMPESCQEEIEEPNSKSKDPATIRTKISKVSSNNHGRKNADVKKQGKKLKRSAKKIDKPPEKEIIPTVKSYESVESKEFETISCTGIISEDDLRSECACEKAKFLKRYEIPEL